MRKTLGTKGSKKCGIRTSGEQARNVMVECCVSAAGEKLLPHFIYARKRMKPFLLDSVTEGL